MKLLLNLLLLLLIALQTSSALWGQPAKSTADTKELLTAARKAIEQNAAKLQSVAAQGNIRHLRFERDVELPTVTLDADLTLVYQAPKFSFNSTVRVSCRTIAGRPSATDNSVANR